MIIADDFGVNIEDDKIICELLNSKRIHGTSILINHIKDDSINLIKNRNHGLIGIHLDLNISPIKSAFLNANNKEVLKEQIDSQIFKFIDVFNSHPDFIDGHRHVHAYFNVPFILINALSKINYDGFVRVSAEKISFTNLLSLYKRGSLIKGVFVSLISLLLANRLKKNNIKFNKKFLGFYDLSKYKDSESSFYEIMALYDQDTLLMVHPGAGKDSSNHSKHLAVNRIMEANLLMEIKK
mgnify:CR=1 FL=1